MALRDAEPTTHRRIRPVPTYGRPEPLARVVRILNDYYERLGDVTEWRGEVHALYESIAQCRTLYRSLEAEPCMRMVAGYGAERVKSSGNPLRDPVLAAVAQHARWLKELDEEAAELTQRCECLIAAVAAAGPELAIVSAAIEELTALQRQVIEARHRDHRSLLSLAIVRGQCDHTAVSHAYRAGLQALRRTLGTS
jgi:hypothetical protein